MSNGENGNGKKVVRVSFKERVRFAKKYDVEIRKIGPPEALELLERNVDHNRKVNQSVVDRYAEDMINGDWADNGAVIRIDLGTKNLIDGQHRLWAVVQSDTVQVFLVVYVRDENAFSTVDTGKVRTPGDIIHMGGFEKNSVLIGAIANLIHRIETQSSRTMTKSKIVEFVQSHEGIVRSADFASKAKRHFVGWLTPTVIGAVHFFWAKADPQRAEGLFQRMGEGEKDGRGPQDPAWVLRQKLIKARMTNGKKIAEGDVLYLLQRCWEADESGERANKNTFQIRPDRGTTFLAGCDHGLTALFEQSGMTRKALAQRLGVNASTLGEWIRGRNRPPQSIVSRAIPILRDAIEEQASAAS